MKAAPGSQKEKDFRRAVNGKPEVFRCSELMNIPENPTPVKQKGKQIMKRRIIIIWMLLLSCLLTIGTAQAATLATLDDLTIQKNVTGDTVPDGKEGTFTFEITADMPTDAPLPSPATVTINGTDVKAGNKTARFGAINYDQPGIYVYKVKENPGGSTDYLYDDKEHSVVVTVKANGTLDCKIDAPVPAYSLTMKAPAEVTPANPGSVSAMLSPTNEDVTATAVWTCSSDLISINPDGTINVDTTKVNLMTADKEKVTVTVTDPKSGLTASKEVTVKKVSLQMSGSNTVAMGETPGKLAVKSTDGRTDLTGSVSWSCSPNDLISVGNDGTITVLKNPGTDTPVTVTATDPATGITGSYIVTVKSKPLTLTLSDPDVSLRTPAQVTSVEEPDGTAAPNVSYTSDRTDLVAIDGSGNITVLNNPTADTVVTITATDENGATGTKTILVKKETLAVTASPTEISKAVNGTVTATVNPFGTDITGTVTWSDDSGGLLTIDSAGNVTVTGDPAADTTVTITATDSTGLTGTATVRVKGPIPLTITGNSTFEEGDTLTLGAGPDADTYSKLSGPTWSLSGTDMLTISASGEVTVVPGKDITANTPATVTLTGTDPYGNTVTATKDITVTPKGAVPVTVSADKTAMFAKTGESITFSAAPTKAADAGKLVMPGSWSVTSGSDLATVDGSGVLTFTAASPITEAKTVEVTWTGKDIYNNDVSGKKEITLKPILISAEITNSETEVYESKTLQMTASETPSTATVASHLWELDDTTYASIDPQSGKLTPKDVSADQTVKVKYTATDDSGNSVTAEKTITIKPVLEKAEITNTESTVYGGKTLTMTASTTPDTTIVPLTAHKWEITKGGTNASIDADTGVLTAGAVTTVQKVTVKYSATDGSGKTVDATKEITINPSLTSAEITNTNTTVYVGDTLTMTAKTTPAPSVVPVKTFTWEITGDGTNYADIDASTGVVTPKAAVTEEHTIEVKYTAEDNGGNSVSAVKNVTIKPKLTSVTIDNTDLEIYENETLTLTATTNPAGADAVTKKWQITEGGTYATIDAASGLLTPKNISANQTVKVKFTATDGSGHTETAEAAVTIKPVLDSVTITGGADMMYEKKSDGTVNTMQLSLGTYLPATVELDSSKTKWTVDNTSAATIDNNGLLTAGDVSAQTEVTVTLSVTDKAGVEKTAVKKVKIQPVLDDSGLSIEGPVSLDEEVSSVSGKTKAAYTIDNRTGITITKQKWSIIANGDAAEIDETTGVLTVKDINQIKTVTIQWEGEDASGYKVTKTHNVEISPILDSCTLIVNNDAGTPIFIGDEVALRITYDPGLNQLPVTETYDPVVPSNLTNMQRFETGEGNSNHPNWTFTANTVSTVDTKEICVKAKVLMQGFERTCCGSVTVTPKLDSVSVTNTDTTIYENESFTFQASATPAVPLKSESWALNGTYDGVTLDTATGALTIDQSKITADTVVEVTYTATDEADVTKTAQGKVTIKPILEGITIKGADEIYEKSSDGTTLTTTTFELDTVTPAGVTLASKTWSIEGDAAGCTIDPSTGVLTAADISDEKTITVKLTAKDGAGNEKTASKTVKIKPILESVTITGGESEIFEKDAGGSFSTLQFGSEYTSTGAEIASTAWSVTGTVAEIDNTGKLTVKSDISENTEVTVTLSMTDKAGNTKTDSKTVKIKPVLEDLAIEGASDLYERTNTIPFPNQTTLTIKGIADSNISSKKWSIIDGTDGASIDDDGVLTAKDVSEIKNVKVQLEVTDINGSTAKAEKTVAVKPA